MACDERTHGFRKHFTCEGQLICLCFLGCSKQWDSVKGKPRPSYRSGPPEVAGIENPFRAFLFRSLGLFFMFQKVTAGVRNPWSHGHALGELLRSVISTPFSLQ